MPIKTYITDPATSREVRVEPDKSLRVSTMPFPPTSKSPVEVFRDYFKDPNGSLDMKVDGSTNNVTYSVNSDSISDIYITTLNIVIADANSTLNDFGNIGGSLDNGCELRYSKGTSYVTIAESLTSNFEFARLCGGNPPVGDAANVFKLSNAVGASEAYMFQLDIQKVFGIPYGIRLNRSSNQSLEFIIKDNVAGVDKFDIIAYGFRRYLPVDSNLHITDNTDLGI